MILLIFAAMQKSSISIDVMLDAGKIPAAIHWNASDSTAAAQQTAKAMFLSFWDGADKTALRIDLWTKNMMVDEMGDFFHQTLISMADTFARATRQTELSNEMRTFAENFQKKFKENLLKEQH